MVEQVEVGNWVVVRTNRGNVEGIVSKVNWKTFQVRLQVAGKHKFIDRHNNDLVEVVM